MHRTKRECTSSAGRVKCEAFCISKRSLKKKGIFLTSRGLISIKTGDLIFIKKLIEAGHKKGNVVITLEHNKKTKQSVADNGGGYAESICLSENQVVKKPSNMTFEASLTYKAKYHKP